MEMEITRSVQCTQTTSSGTWRGVTRPHLGHSRWTSTWWWHHQPSSTTGGGSAGLGNFRRVGPSAMCSQRLRYGPLSPAQLSSCRCRDLRSAGRSTERSGPSTGSRAQSATWTLATRNGSQEMPRLRRIMRRTMIHGSLSTSQRRGLPQHTMSALCSTASTGFPKSVPCGWQALTLWWCGTHLCCISDGRPKSDSINGSKLSRTPTASCTAGSRRSLSGGTRGHGGATSTATTSEGAALCGRHDAMRTVAGRHACSLSLPLIDGSQQSTARTAALSRRARSSPDIDK
mmetsp:Transcript_35784/g.93629  ORF Transcript_35784/g.93629 Transcript_35784/m.93629 type:complete len:287 (+) Transcript_35784:1032-1892(+)